MVWFRQLESYKRIDAMCTLLTSCLSFELRFLGTYLEDLASRDYEGLRSMELRVSNAPELVQNLATCQQAVPTDQRVRRMMAMYLALIRNVNRKCCNELYKTLELWGRQECMDKYVDQDELFVQELLLIYIMAKNHPVLGFEQRLKCAEIFQMLYEQMVVVIGGEGGPAESSSSPGQTHPVNNNEHQCPLSESPSPTLQMHLQQQQQTHSQGQTPLNSYQQQQQILHGAGGLHSQIPHNHQQQQHLVHQQQFLDSSATPSAVTSHLYGPQQSQHPQLIQTTSATSSSSNSGQQQFQQNVVVGQQQQQQQQAGGAGAGHIQVHPGHQLVAAYPQVGGVDRERWKLKFKAKKDKSLNDSSKLLRLISSLKFQVLMFCVLDILRYWLDRCIKE